jgi:hypothetical protein
MRHLQSGLACRLECRTTAALSPIRPDVTGGLWSASIGRQGTQRKQGVLGWSAAMWTHEMYDCPSGAHMRQDIELNTERLVGGGGSTPANLCSSKDSPHAGVWSSLLAPASDEEGVPSSSPWVSAAIVTAGSNVGRPPSCVRRSREALGLGLAACHPPSATIKMPATKFARMSARR